MPCPQEEMRNYQSDTNDALDMMTLSNRFQNLAGDDRAAIDVLHGLFLSAYKPGVHWPKRWQKAVQRLSHPSRCGRLLPDRRCGDTHGGRRLQRGEVQQLYAGTVRRSGHTTDECAQCVIESHVVHRGCCVEDRITM